MEGPDEEIWMTERVHRYSDMVLRIALTYLKNKADAQDICQQVFVKLFRQRERREHFRDDEHEKAWVIRVTANACKDVLRSPWKRRFFPLREELLPMPEEEGREVVSHVLALPPKYRIAVYLHYYENYRTAEIADMLGQKENTVRTHLKRGRELLKARLTGGFGDE